MKMLCFKYVLIFSLPLYFFSINNAYTFINRDSLKNLIQQTEDEYIKVRLLNDLGQTYEHNNPELAIRLSNEALNIAKWNNNKVGIIDAYINIAFGYFFSNNFSKALENFFLASRYLNKTTDYLRLAKTYRNIALSYKYIKSPQESLKYSKLCYLTLKKKPDDDLLTDCYYDFACAHALLGNHKKEIAYLEKAIELRIENKQMDKLGDSYNCIAVAYFKSNQFDKSLKYFNLYKTLSIKYKDSLSIARAYNNVGEILFKKGEYLDALESYQKALALNQSNIAYTYMGLANCYSKLKNPAKATYFFNMARNSGADLNSLLKSCDMLVQYYRQSHNYDRAFHYSDIYKSINDSLNIMSKKEVELANPKYEVEGIEERIAEKEINDLLKENFELQKSQNRYLIIILTLTFIIGVSAIYFYRRRLRDRETRLKDISTMTFEMQDFLNSLKKGEAS